MLNAAVACPLTDRQRQILQLLANDLDQRQAAEHLQISHKTVRNHMHSVIESMSGNSGAFERLGVHTAAGAVAIGLREGWLE